MAVWEVEPTSLQPVVVLGLLNSMAVIVANTETLLAGWEALCADGDAAREMLERVDAHARLVADALEVVARDVPSELLGTTSQRSSP
jgi:hypothetical protein